MTQVRKIGLGKAVLPIMLAISAAAVVVLQMGFIFLMFALLPSLIAYYVDRDAHLSTLKTVFACNLAACLPVIVPMVKAGMSMKSYDVTAIMTNPLNWMIVYLGAAIGWCLIYLCRFIANFFITLGYEYKIVSLERLQRRLVEEWGQIIKQQ